MAGTLLTIPNLHVAPAPEMNGRGYEYIAYYRSRVVSDQWITWIAAGQMYLAGGDIDWHIHPVKNGKALGGLIMAFDEEVWLMGQWTVARALGLLEVT